MSSIRNVPLDEENQNLGRGSCKGHQISTESCQIKVPEKALESSSLKSSEQSAYTDSGFFSGSNIQSEEIETPNSPVSPEPKFNYPSDKVLSDTNSMKFIDSGIDVSVSQRFSELNLENDLSKTSSSTQENLNKTIFTSKSEGSTGTKWDPSEWFQQNEDGDTELHLSIVHKFIEPTYALVRLAPHQMYLDIKNDDRQTPLHLAVLTKQPRFVRLLVVAGASVDTVDRFGNTALHLAVRANDIQSVRAIITPVETPEIHTAQLQYVPYHSHNQKNIADIHNYEGQTCVHLAALNGNLPILRNLIWYGADIRAKEWKGGYTCLHLAVEKKDLALCEFLLSETKIDPEEPSYAGHTAYKTACFGWNRDIANLLAGHGVVTYLSSESESDDDDIVDSCFPNGYLVNGGLVNVGA